MCPNGLYTCTSHFYWAQKGATHKCSMCNPWFSPCQRQFAGPCPCHSLCHGKRDSFSTWFRPSFTKLSSQKHIMHISPPRCFRKAMGEIKRKAMKHHTMGNGAGSQWMLVSIDEGLMRKRFCYHRCRCLNECTHSSPISLKLSRIT